MEQTFSFAVSPMDTAALRLQVRDALEKRSELLSRQQYPKMWELTDKLNRVGKVSQTVQDKRRRRRTALGFLDWLLSLVLLIPGFMEPKELLAPLLVGAACFGIGTVILWRNLRRLLPILSLPLGLLLLFGAVNNPQELGRLLALALVLLALGAAAWITRRRPKQDPYDRAAQALLAGRDDPKVRVLRVLFDSDAMTVTIAGSEDGSRVPYDQMVMILETEDLLLSITDEIIVLLQKQDLCTGTITDLREWLQSQVSYHIL